ncbi:MAG: hypothetical protein SVK44_09510 [Nitrospirota bacterium]|nr:hypothetical protein [Nitrospirota bacterium]
MSIVRRRGGSYTGYTTPSWLWHAHKNDGDTPGLIFPVQDAGLVAWQRLDKIEFAP